MKLLTYRSKTETLESICELKDINIVDYIYNERNEIIHEGFIDLIQPANIGCKKWVISVRFGYSPDRYAYLTEDEKWIDFIPERVNNIHPLPVIVARYRKKTKTDEKRAEAIVKRCIRTGSYYLNFKGLRIDKFPKDMNKCCFISDLNISDTLIDYLDPDLFCKFLNLSRISAQRSLISEISNSILELKFLSIVEVSSSVKIDSRCADKNKVAIVKYK